MEEDPESTTDPVEFLASTPITCLPSNVAPPKSEISFPRLPPNKTSSIFGSASILTKDQVLAGTSFGNFNSSSESYDANPANNPGLAKSLAKFSSSLIAKLGFTTVGLKQGERLSVPHPTNEVILSAGLVKVTSVASILETCASAMNGKIKH